MKLWTRLMAGLLCCLLLAGCASTGAGGAGLSGTSGTTASSGSANDAVQQTEEQAARAVSYSLSDIPAYSGEPYVVLANNVPGFSEEDMTTNSFETYSPLDDLGRCGTAYACVGVDLMPTEERGSISSVKPTGWQSVKYDCVDGKYLYNRCHLIGFQLSGENANKQNLITGTRYLNVDGMLPFENMVADYVKETENHVLYRITPIFEGDNLVADGVEMEALSVEDNGEDISFHVFAYNVQPGVVIDYATGESYLADEAAAPAEDNAATDNAPSNSAARQYVLNTKSLKFHNPDCSSVSSISEANREDFTGSGEDLIAQGYAPCGQCKP